MPKSKHRKKKAAAANAKPQASWIGTGNKAAGPMSPGGMGVLMSNNPPENPIFHHMKTTDMFDGKTKIRTDMLSYLEPFADNKVELTAFAVAASTYFLEADGGDPTMIVETLRNLATETEAGRVPYLDVEGGDVSDKEFDE